MRVRATMKTMIVNENDNVSDTDSDNVQQIQ